MHCCRAQRAYICVSWTFLFNQMLRITTQRTIFKAECIGIFQYFNLEDQSGSVAMSRVEFIDNLYFLFTIKW